MAHANNTQAEFNSAFSKIDEIIRQETHNDASIIMMIADVIQENHQLAYSLAKHVGDILNAADGEIVYTDVISQAYYNAIFNLETADMYGVNVFSGNSEAALSWADAIVAHHTSGSTSGHVSRNGIVRLQ